MPTVPLPENPSLDHLKGQAKLVADLVRSGDEGAQSMIDEFHPRMAAADLTAEQRASFKLTDAQLIVARLYGFSSWSRLRQHLAIVAEFSHTPAAERQDRTEDSESFVELACLNYAENGPSPADRVAQAERMLSADADVATASLAAMVVVGDHRAVAAALDAAPHTLDAPCGPNHWPPLLYCTYARIEADTPGWSRVDTLDVLLDRGADPNAGFLWRGLVPPFTALTGALGAAARRPEWHPDRLVMARRLLEAGADPNDGQGLYNNGIGGANHDDPSHLRLLVEFGLGTDRGGPWYRRLGEQLLPPAELLEHELEAAAHRGRPNCLRYLLGLGLDPTRPIGRFGNTPARLAATAGHDEVLAVLADAGVDTALEPAERFLRHVRANDVAAIDALLAENPALADTLRRDHPGMVGLVTAEGREVLGRLVELGFDVNARTGGSGTTALHGAAQADDVPLAALLVEHGADPNLPDRHIGSTPWGWANHFHQDRVAGYLRPLTDGDERIAVTVRTLGNAEEITTLASLDAVLDALDRSASAPTLVRLESGGANLSIGLGHPDVSLVLYRDPDGESWHVVGDADRSEPITFLGDQHVQDPAAFDFEPHAALQRTVARDVAREFALAPTERWSGVDWRVEGGG